MYTTIGAALLTIGLDQILKDRKPDLDLLNVVVLQSDCPLPPRYTAIDKEKVFGSY
jgi:hypothetical protein